MQMGQAADESPSKSAAMYGAADESMADRCDEQEKTIKF